ncbi:hypothetical protein IFM89_001806 [Coptis chinensis]|uniref:F-box domain-containing protein n=1 Tax=Coptis chinensis TaxID=261450 RepID=A0A835LLZ4_9MAGN|nr:hypothetical protein IFM89_001806 [Coptis chinensis]
MCSSLVQDKQKKAMEIKRKKACKKHFPDWAGLPDDIVNHISKKLPVLSTLSMGSVCKSWRRVMSEEVSATRKRGLPWLMLRGQNDSGVRACLSVLENKVWNLEVPEALGGYLWGSIEDWLIVVKLNVFKPDMFFWNPFSKTKVVLPMENYYCKNYYGKMVLSASPNKGNYVVLLLGGVGTPIACWTPGVRTWHRQCLQGLLGSTDVVGCNGYFYFITRDFNISMVGVKSIISAMKQGEAASDASALELHHQRIEMPERPTWKPVRLYLVESCGEVLLVCRFFEDFEGVCRVTRTFEVFKLDVHRDRMVWTKMESLGDRVLFIGTSDSRSFSAKELGVDIPNCIYFFNDFFTNIWTEWGHFSPSPGSCSFEDWGVFSLDGNRFIPNSCNRGKKESFPPIWITAPTWWYFNDSNCKSRSSLKRKAQTCGEGGLNRCGTHLQTHLKMNLNPHPQRKRT